MRAQNARRHGRRRAGLLVVLVPWLAFAAPADTPPDPNEFAIDLDAGAEPGDGSIRRITLNQALDIALADNIELALARAEQEVAQARRLTARGSLLAPSLLFGAGYGRVDGRIQGSFGLLADRTFSTYQGGAALVYENNIGAGISEAIAQGKGLAAAALEALSTEQRLLLRVAELYEDLKLATVGVDIARELIDSGEEFLKIAAARAEAGVGLGADVSRARAKLASDRQQLIEAVQARNDTSRRLALTLRIGPQDRLVPDEARLTPRRLAMGPDHTEMRPAPGEGIEFRPDVLATHQRAEAARMQARAAFWELLSPELRAEFGQIEIGATSSDLERRSQYRAMLLWTISPGEIGTLRERRAEEEAARLRSIESEFRAVSEIQETEQDLQAASRSIPLAGQGLDAAAENLRLSQARFKAGTAITLEVLDAQNVLAHARFTLARSIVAYNTAQVRYLAATGRLSRDIFDERTPTLPASP